jgi:heme/copper-type cytochrome/quinol oxidase subunit 2
VPHPTFVLYDIVNQKGSFEPDSAIDVAMSVVLIAATIIVFGVFVALAVVHARYACSLNDEYLPLID